MRPPARGAPVAQPGPAPLVHPSGLWAAGERLTWLAALVLTLSVFMSWYSGSEGEGPTIGVTGWNSGPLGQIVFFCGVAVLALVALREAGIEMPALLPESLLVIAIGSIATVLVVIRVISIPDDVSFYAGARAIGLWISLLAAVGVIVAGLLRTSEEL